VVSGLDIGTKEVEFSADGEVSPAVRPQVYMPCPRTHSHPLVGAKAHLRDRQFVTKLETILICGAVGMKLAWRTSPQANCNGLP